MFGYTLIVGNTSKRGKIYAEVFATNFGWNIAFPMKSNYEDHETLSLMFQRCGLLTRMIFDGSKYQAEVDFVRKCTEAVCYLKQTDPYYSFQNSA